MKTQNQTSFVSRFSRRSTRSDRRPVVTTRSDPQRPHAKRPLRASFSDRPSMSASADPLSRPSVTSASELVLPKQHSQPSSLPSTPAEWQGIGNVLRV